MRLILFSTILLFLNSVLTLAQNKEKPERLISGMHTISSHQLFDHVKELTAEKYGGRLTGTRGYDSAAAWLSTWFRECGLKPLGEKGSYLQKFTVPYTLVSPGCRLTLNISDGKETVFKDYRYVSEFIPGSTSDSGIVRAEVVYAGYAITAPELQYDDFAGVDVRGKIVLVEPEVPFPPGKDPVEFLKWEPYSYHQYKLKNVADHGAVGMLYNYGPIANPNNSFIKGMIYSHVGDSVVKDLFKGTGRTHSGTISAIREKLLPASFVTDKEVTIKNNTRHFPAGVGSNVAGILEGSDPVLKNEAVMLGAHLDHLGYCYDLMPGANDNASGIAVMIEVMRAIKAWGGLLKRSVIFIAFGAEEQGVAGSKFYVENPLFPLKKTVGLLNLDAVGVGNRISALGGKNFPDLYTAMESANDQFVHRSMQAGVFANITRPRLDAGRFEKAGVPILSFSTGGIPYTYHQPGDNLDTITPEIMEDLARILFVGIVELANR